MTSGLDKRVGSSIDRLKGRVAVVTGASAGIGWATAKALAIEGAKVIVTARRETRLRELCSQIGDAGGEADLLTGDASLEQTAQAAIALALSRFGKLDILINNAGQGNYKQFAETTAADYDELMNANMRSSFVFSRAAVPHLLQQRSGIILFISSVAGLQGYANEAVYCASKFAQVGFAQAIENELRPFGVKVGVLCPGGVKTEFAIGRGRTEKSVADSYMMDAAEVAESIVFACALPKNMRVTQMTVRHMGEPHR